MITGLLNSKSRDTNLADGDSISRDGSGGRVTPAPLTPNRDTVPGSGAILLLVTGASVTSAIGGEELASSAVETNLNPTGVVAGYRLFDLRGEGD